jgi:small subunit ribosomal protein S8
MHADPIADMLTRIRNAVHRNLPEVQVRGSRVCEGIAKVLQEQGYINRFDRIETACKQDMLQIQLKYGPLGEPVIQEIKRASKPSRRLYSKVADLPKVLGGLGIVVVSTSRGMLTDDQCRQQKIGGELICTVS